MHAKPIAPVLQNLAAALVRCKGLFQFMHFRRISLKIIINKIELISYKRYSK